MKDKEIVQALRVCSRRTDAQTCAKCPLFDSEDCMGDMMVGAADLIERLTAENAKAEAERDAAIADLKITAGCASCEYKCYSRSTCCDCTKKQNCKCMSCHLDRVNWQWRGLPGAPEEGEKA